MAQPDLPKVVNDWNRSVALVVVTEPLLLVALFPDAPTVTSSGVAGLRPLYSKIECPGTPPPR